MARGEPVKAGPAAEPAAIAAVRGLYALKSAEELRLAHVALPAADTVPDTGDPDAAVLLVKGHPGPAEASGLPVMSGPDGVAAARALEALGFDPASIFWMLSRPVAAGGQSETPSTGCSAAVSERVRLVIEAVDPFAVVALDPTAAVDVAAAFALEPLSPGRSVRVLGRTILALGGLEASLNDPAQKRRVWDQFRALKTPADPW